MFVGTLISLTGYATSLGSDDTQTDLRYGTMSIGVKRVLLIGGTHKCAVECECVE